MNKIENVLLIRPNSTKDMKDPYIVFPLGIGYIAAVLKKEGYSVSIIDLTMENVDYESLSRRIRAIDPHVIGVTALSYSYAQIKKMSSFLKSVTPVSIILGGHLSTYNYDIVLSKTDIDICVLGEGERTIVDLLRNMDDLKRVNGIAYKFSEDVQKNPPRELIADLDTLPFPAYELFDIDKYTPFDDVYMSKRHISKGVKHKKMSLEAGRGCPFKCHFCSKTFDRIRKRSTDSVIEEIEFLQASYGIDTFWFQDELLFSDKKYMFEFCDRIKDLKIGWYGNARIDSVDKEMIKRIKESKCLEVAYGVESGSPKILKNMNKKIIPEEIVDILTYSLKIDMPIDMGLILGYIGEDESTVSETLSMLGRIGYPGLRFRYITPYPGSPLYNMCKEKGIIRNEEEYLISLGDGTGPYRSRVNLSDFSDERLAVLLKETIDKSFRKYIMYLIKHPLKLFARIFQKDVMNPVYVIYNRFKRATNYDKARKK